MAEKILVTPHALETAAARLRAISAEFENSVNRCNVDMQLVGSTWRDELYSVANGRFDSVLGGQLSDIPETINAYAAVISASLRVFGGLDQSIKERIMGMEFSAAVATVAAIVGGSGSGGSEGNTNSPARPADGSTGTGSLINGNIDMQMLNNFKNAMLDESRWIHSPPGTLGATRGIDDDGAFGAQCADIARAWYRMMFGEPTQISAWNNSGTVPMANIPNTSRLTQVHPSIAAGDIAFIIDFTPQRWSAAGTGHVVVVLSDPDASGFVDVIEQNHFSEEHGSHSPPAVTRHHISVFTHSYRAL